MNKKCLAYAAGNVDYLQFAKDYANRGGVTTLAPQVYSINGDFSLAPQSLTYPFSDTTFVAKCRQAGIDVVPLVMGGGNFPGGDTLLLSLIKNPAPFANNLVNLCKEIGYKHIQLDWETGIPSQYMALMTSALESIATVMHEANLELSLTSYFADYQQIFNTWQLSPVLDYQNVQAYYSSIAEFQNNVNAMLNGMQPEYWNRLQVAFGDYPNTNAPIAGECMSFLISKQIQSIAVWPAYGTEISNAGYGYKDTVYNTQNYHELFALFLRS